MNLKRVAVYVLAGLFLYLSLYTWNLRTGHLDTLAEHTGLDLVGILIKPGRLVADKASEIWGRYVHLVGLKEENDRLRAELDRLMLENADLRERAEAARRMEALLAFAPPSQWSVEGGRVIAHRMGPNSVLETILVDKGSLHGASAGMAALTPRGVVGRVLRVGFANSTVALIHDPNSRIAVIGQKNRAAGVLVGQGPGRRLQLRYVNLNAPIEVGETLVTSGLAGQYPKGLPVARVVRVERSDMSLFLEIDAEPLDDFDALEEVLLLRRTGEADRGD